MFFNNISKVFNTITNVTHIGESNHRSQYVCIIYHIGIISAFRDFVADFE